LRFTGAIAEAVQCASHVFAMTDKMRNATDNLIDLPVLAASDSITFARMGEAIQHDSGIAIEDFATAGGLVMQANEIAFIHLFSSPFHPAESRLFPAVNCDHLL
jgi:hypothetical protein